MAERDVSVDYLRATLTLMVVGHHAALAYTSFARYNPKAYLESTAPIVDPARWAGFDFLENFNDVFFMAWMFLIGGLFVWSSLQRKGVGRFLRDRLLRLGAPFGVGAIVLVPLWYYPSAALGEGRVGYLTFWRQCLLQDGWPSGPLWFIWMLLGFNVVAALAFQIWPNLAGGFAALIERLRERSIRLLALIVGLTAVAYIPLVVAVGSGRWVTLGGPLWFQLSRVGLYGAYFFLGLLLGAAGMDRGPFARGAALARRWVAWAAAAVAVYVTLWFLPLLAPYVPLPLHKPVYALVFLSSCAVSGLAFMALFRRFAIRPSKIFQSLSDNAYGIYLVHYGFVVWLQYSLLPSELPAIAKFTAVALGATVASWAVTAALRRVTVVRSVI